MKKIACLGVMMAASAAFAATYTWNGATGAAWATGENWLDGETPAAWTDGASASFGAGASVSLPGSVAVSNLTTAGALVISGPGPDATFLSKDTPTLVFPGITLDDVAGPLLMADLNGSAIGQYKPAKAYHYKRNGSTATAQFQMIHSTHLRCVKVIFTESPDGILAKTGNISYYIHGNNGGSSMLGVDIDTAPNVQTWSVTTSLSGSGMTVSNLRGTGPHVRVAGKIQLGGAMELTNAVVELTAPISQTVSKTVAGQDGSIFAKGFADTTVEKTFGITQNGTGDAMAWLTTTASDHVFTNMALSRTSIVRGEMGGHSIGIRAPADPYHVKYNGQTLTFQLQFGATSGSGQYYIKGCKVELKQEGANVTARGVKAYYHVGGTLGEDLDNTSGVTTYSDVANNGVKNLTLQTVDLPSVTFNISSASVNMVADNAQMVFTASGARPKAELVARNGAQVVFAGGGGNGAGAGRTYTFESGSVLLPLATQSTEGNAQYIFDNATLYLPLLHSTWKDGQNMMRYITLRNGARTIGNPTRSGDCSSLTITSELHSPLRVGLPIVRATAAR